MKQIFDKLKNDKLSAEELTQLRQSIAHMSDSEIGSLLDDNTFPSDEEKYPMDEKSFLKVKKRINLVATQSDRKLHRYRILSIAAAVIIPILLASCIWLFIEVIGMHQYDGVMEKELAVVTSKGESAVATLPDATEVTLMSQSSLKYTLKDFKDNGREILFEGDGVFNVKANRESPFRIICKNLEIVVTGTKFSLSARNDSDMASIYLESGKVEIECGADKHSVGINPGEFARINTANGNVEISEVSQNSANAMMRGDKIFENISLSEVLLELERSYGKKFEFRRSDMLSDKFTGYLPSDNLEEVIETIENCYHVKSVIEHDRIIFM